MFTNARLFTKKSLLTPGLTAVIFVDFVADKFIVNVSQNHGGIIVGFSDGI